MLAPHLVELFFLSLGKFHRHQLLSALAHPAQGRPHVSPAEAQNPAGVGHCLQPAERSPCGTHIPPEGGDGGPAGRQSATRRALPAPGPRDAPGSPGMLRRLPALPRLPARGRPRRTLRRLRLRLGWMPFSKRRERDSPRASGSTVVSP